MLKLKKVFISAGFGFVLSFLISIIATHHIGWTLLRSAIFAVIFGGLAFGIQFLYEKFLSETDDSLVESQPPRAAESRGGNVDINIGDENLTDDGSGPQFAVGSGSLGFASSSAQPQGAPRSQASSGPKPTAEEIAAMPHGPAFGGSGAKLQPEPEPVPASGASPAPRAAEVSPAPAKEEAPAFTPVQLGVPLEKPQENAGKATTAAPAKEEPPAAPRAPLTAKEQAAAERKAKQEADMKEVDSLPDLGDVSFGSAEEGADGEVIDDSEFASSGTVDSGESERISLVDGSQAANHDAETMAKAIQTLLKKDD